MITIILTLIALRLLEIAMRGIINYACTEASAAISAAANVAGAQGAAKARRVS